MVLIIDEKLVNKALSHTHKRLDEILEVYEIWFNKHPNKGRQVSRMDSLWELVHLYYYLVDTKLEDKAYKAYFGTLEEMLFQDGLIVDCKAGYPMNQFISRSVERLVVEWLIEKNPNDCIEINNSKGLNDRGIDFLWNGKKVDVKTVKHKTLLNQSSALGRIKGSVLTDTSKETDVILWTANLISFGYICLIVKRI